MDRLRLAFAGTPEFARAALLGLHAAGFDLRLVLCQPDRPAGRGLRIVPAPVKAGAISLGLPVLQPAGLRLDGRHAAAAAAARAALEAAAVDAIVVAAYGLILPPWALALPRLGCINIHASLLPRWRGAAPIQRAIEAGDTVTGVTIMQMDAGLDTGSILLAETVPIGADETSARLQARLAALGSELVVRALDGLARADLVARPQPPDGVTYARKIEKADAVIDWTASATSIERRIRAFDPQPGARSTLDGETLIVWSARVVPAAAGAPGEIVAVDAAAITVACGAGALAVTELQRPGGRRLSAAEFVRGRAPRRGAVFAARPAEAASPPV